MNSGLSDLKLMPLVSPFPAEMCHETGGHLVALTLRAACKYINSDKQVLMRKGKNKERVFIGRLDSKQGLTEVSFRDLKGS